MTGESKEWAEAVLRWYLEAGVDEAILENPVDRYCTTPAADAKSGPVADAALQPEVARPPSTGDADQSRPGVPYPLAAAPRGVVPGVVAVATSAVENAYAVASGALSLDELRRALDCFDGCPLRRTATNLVFGDGVPDAKIVFIGEAPGAEEDRRGLPFVGPSGRLLDKMLASIGLDRSNVFISNTIFWRPPGNRSPMSSEVASCIPFVERMLELIAPELLVALGGPAANVLLGQSESVGRLRGRWFPYQTARMARPIEATAIFHPAYLLRTPVQKRHAWRDLLAIRQKLNRL